MFLELAIAFQSFTVPNYAQSWSCFNPRFTDAAPRFTTPWFVPRGITRGNELLFVAPDHAPIQVFITGAGGGSDGVGTSTIIIRRIGKGSYRVLAAGGATITANVPIEPVGLEGFAMSFCDDYHQNSTPKEVRRMVWFFHAKGTNFATNNRPGWLHCGQNASDYPSCKAETNLLYWLGLMSPDERIFIHETGPESVNDRE